MPSNSQSKKTMDIDKPGDTKPDSSSRPIIISNHSVMQDPMVNATVKKSDSGSEQTEETAPEVKSPAMSKRVIEPLSSQGPEKEDEATDNVENSKENQKLDENNEQEKPDTEIGEQSEGSKTNTEPPKDFAKEEVKTLPDQVSKDEAKKDDTAKPNESNDSAVVNAVIESAGNKKAELDSVEVADEKRNQAAQVLIESKKYNVAIGQVSKAKKSRQVVFLIVLVVFVIVGYLAIDFGLITVPFELPVKIFNNNF